jgi:hypothetical protein
MGGGMSLPTLFASRVEYLAIESEHGMEIR